MEKQKTWLWPTRVSVDVRKLIRPPASGSRQRWATFMRNHLHETLAIDFTVVPTVTFGIVYVFRELRRAG